MNFLPNRKIRIIIRLQFPMNEKIKILIVEDEALIAQNLKLTLEDFGYEVCSVCYTYETALNCIRDKDFDILLLDINLGNHFTQTGLELASLLPQIKQIPFIFLTAFSDRETVLKASKLNPSAYLVKPVNGAGLFAAIQTAIANYTQKKTAAVPGERQEFQNDFYTKIGQRYVKVGWHEVHAISSGKNYCMLLTANNPGGFAIRISLQQALQTFIPEPLRNKYVQISRNMAILKNTITEIKGVTVITSHGNYDTTKFYRDEIVKDVPFFN